MNKKVDKLDEILVITEEIEKISKKITNAHNKYLDTKMLFFQSGEKVDGEAIEGWVPGFLFILKAVLFSILVIISLGVFNGLEIGAWGLIVYLLIPYILLQLLLFVPYKAINKMYRNKIIKNSGVLKQKMDIYFEEMKEISEDFNVIVDTEVMIIAINRLRTNQNDDFVQAYRDVHHYGYQYIVDTINRRGGVISYWLNKLE